MTNKQQPVRKLSAVERLQAALDGYPTPMTNGQRDELRPIMTALLARSALGAAYVDYQLTGNPLYLLDGFMVAHRSGSPRSESLHDLRCSAALSMPRGQSPRTGLDAYS